MQLSLRRIKKAPPTEQYAFICAKYKGVFTVIRAYVCLDYFWKDTHKTGNTVWVGSCDKDVRNGEGVGLLFFLYNFASYKFITIILYSIPS